MATTYISIPLKSDFPWYSFQTTLSGTLYTLTARYNVRSQRWMLDIGDASNNPILTGLPILVNRNINQQYVVSGAPVGYFFCVDNTQQENQPTRNSFGNTHELFYADPTT